MNVNNEASINDAIVHNKWRKTNPENTGCSQQCPVEQMSAAWCYLMQFAAVPHSFQQKKMH